MEGKKIMNDLLKKADVYVENVRPGAADRGWFLGWKDVHTFEIKIDHGFIKGIQSRVTV